MSRTPWFRDWFGEEYLAVYPHRDLEEAARGVRLLREATGRDPGARVLDLACGAGRHLLELDRAGYRAVGLDLSRRLLLEGRREGVGAPVVRADMRRLPFRTGSFDVVTNFFTSFGYFTDPGDDRRVLEEVRRVLGEGGHVLLDFLNAERVRRDLTPVDEREVDGATVTQERRLLESAEGGARVEKRITISRPGEPERAFVERVRLYEEAELREMMAAAGIRTDEVFGDYLGGPIGPDAPRCILTGRAA